MFSTPGRPLSFSEWRGAAHSSPAATSVACRTGLASAIRLSATGSINAPQQDAGQFRSASYRIGAPMRYQKVIAREETATAACRKVQNTAG